jgi:hypothetical protein
MPVLIMMNKRYNDDEALETVVRYVLRTGCGYCGGYGVDMNYPVQQMQQVKVLWGKDHGRRVRHFILSFKKLETIGYEQLMRLGFEICKYYSDYQSVYGLHTDTDHLHLHFAVNTVSYKDGKMYAGGLSDWYRLQGYIQGLLPQWYVDLRASDGVSDREYALEACMS